MEADLDAEGEGVPGRAENVAAHHLPPALLHVVLGACESQQSSPPNLEYGFYDFGSWISDLGTNQLEELTDVKYSLAFSTSELIHQVRAHRGGDCIVHSCVTSCILIVNPRSKPKFQNRLEIIQNLGFRVLRHTRVTQEAFIARQVAPDGAHHDHGDYGGHDQDNLRRKDAQLYLYEGGVPRNRCMDRH